MPAKKPAPKKPAPKKPAKKPAAKPAASTKAVWQKLFIKPGCVLIDNAPKGYTKWLKGSKAVALEIDMVRLQASDDQGVENAWIFPDDLGSIDFTLGEIGEFVRPETNLIVGYKKGDPAFHRDTLNAEMKKHGFEGFALIAVDDTWSAMRFKKT